MQTTPPPTTPSRWIIAYDITHPKRLSRIWRILRRQAMPLQHSIYLFAGNQNQLQRLLDTIEPLIDQHSDDIRAYPLGANTRIWTLGQQNLDSGNPLIDEVLDTMAADPAAYISI